MKRILVPTDFSENTHSAIEYAIDIVNKVKGEILLLNTYKLQRRAGMFIGVERLMRKESKEGMAKLAAKIEPRLKPGVVFNYEVVKGNPVKTIALAAKKMKADLIVMGTQGSNGLKEVFIVSTTNGVINHTKIPVLAVPAGFAFKPLKTIVLSVSPNINKLAEKITPLKQFSMFYNAEILGLHVKSGNENEAIEQQFKKVFSETKCTFFEIEGNASNVNAIIQEFVKTHQADLLCMIKQSRSFWENLFHNSVTTKEVFQSVVPILVFKN